jgi:hypothetical protein
MINDEEVSSYVGKEIPELTAAIEKGKCRNAYDVVKQLFTYTASQIVTQNVAAARKGLALAEQLYDNGNRVVKNAIENIFVYSFSHTFFLDGSNRREVMQLMPNGLKRLYKAQVINSHI